MSSPAVQVQELSSQHYIPNVTNETAVFVGHFERGPVDVPVFITDINDFKFIFGRGVDNHYNDWYQVYNYLQYSSGVWVTRSCGPRVNANNGDDLTIDKYSQWQEQYDSIVPNPARFIARTPGTWGNLLSIGVIGLEEYNSNVLIGHGVYAQNAFTYFEEGNFGICIFKDGLLVETFYKPVGNIEDLNTESKYLYSKVDNSVLPTEILEIIDFIDNSGVLDMGSIDPRDSRDDFGSINSGTEAEIDLGLISGASSVYGGYIFYGETLIQFSNGFNSIPTNTDLANSYSLFEDDEYFDVDIIIGNDRANEFAINLAETRKDCIAFIGFPTILVEYLKLLMGAEKPIVAYTPDGYVISLGEFKIPAKMTELLQEKIDEYIDLLPQSIYAHFSMNVKVQYDYFTNELRLINMSGDAAGLKAEASLRNPWTVGAGLERGQIKKLDHMYMNLTKAQRDRYYKMGCNYVESGAMVTQKTFSTTPSNFNSVNIRSLFNHIEKETKYILRNVVFEDNSLQVRQNIASLLKMYLKDIKANNGIENARVLVYPGAKNEIIVEVAIKPRYVAETITIQMTNAGTDDFSSVIS
jgi:hypothetical protein